MHMYMTPSLSLMRLVSALLALATVTLVGCGWRYGESVEPPDGATDTFTLRLVGVDRMDSVFEVESRRAPAGQKLYLVVTDGTSASPPCPAPLDPVCLSINGQVVIEEEATADGDGEAWWYVPFSAAGGGGELGVQLYSATGAVSNGLVLQIP